MPESIKGRPSSSFDGLSNQPLRTFQDNLSTLRTVNRRVVSPIALARQEMRLGYEWGRKLIIEKKAGETPAQKQRLHKLFNGEAGAEVLQDKFLFGNLVRELGYQAPQSVLVSTGAQDAELLSQVDALDTDVPRRFCKPLGGNGGKGVYLAATPEDAVMFAQNRGQDYLIQTFEEPQQEWRYILHRDNSQLQPDTMPGWRMTYEKIRPKVVGNGSSSVAQLVQADTTIPDYAKNYYFKYQRRIHSNSLNDVPASGEQIELCDSGNMDKGAYIRTPEEGESQNLDNFMLRFYQDLEDRIGSPINTFAVDIGVKDPSILDGTFDYEKMRDNIVFYEFQLPFNTNGCFDDFPKDESRTGFSRIVPKKLYKRLQRAKLGYNIIKSQLVTGALTQRAENSKTVYESSS